MKKSSKALLLIVVAGFAVAAVVGVIAIVKVAAKPKIEDHSWLVVDYHGQILEYAPPSDMAGEILGEKPETLHRILANLEKAAVDDRIDGIILKVSANSSSGFAIMQEVRGAIAKVREQGKKVYALADLLDRNTYFLAAACDEVYAYPTSYISFTGFAAGSIHIRGSLDKLGINPNLHKIKDYKAAAEMITRTDMSETARENRQWLVDEFWAMFVEALEQDRGLTEEQVIEVMNHAVLTAEEALELDLVDRTLYWDELEAELMQEGDDELRTVSQARYAGVCPSKLGLKGKRKIAVVHAQGTIGGRKSRINPLLGVMMGHESVIADLRAALLDEDVEAVVFRIDSGGGDALTSDLIGHQVEVVGQSKPIVASMVNVAASGGYHIAYRANKIVADPMTVTGSIGSINAKFNMAGLYDRLGLSFDFVTKGPNAMFFSTTRDFTEEEWQRFVDNHWAGFNEWLTDVAEHRGMTFEEAEQLAHGRVWSGRQALDNGLVDELGGLDRAIEVAKELAGIPAEERAKLVHYPEKKTLMELIFEKDSERAALARWSAYQLMRQELADTATMISQPMWVMEPIHIQ